MTVLVLFSTAVLAAAVWALRASHRRRDRRADQEWEHTEAPFWAALRDGVHVSERFHGEADAA